MLKISVCLLVLGYSVLSKEIPSYVPLCDRKDPEVAQCFIDSVNTLRPYLLKGIPEMNMPPIDPLEIEKVTLDSKESPSVQAVIVVTNSIIRGLKDFTILKHTMDFEKAVFYVEMYIPMVMINGEYDFQGLAFHAHIKTTGRFDLNTTDVKFSGNWYGTYHTKKGKEYLYIDRVVLDDLKTGKVDVNVEDKQGASLIYNDLINKNADKLMQDFNPLIRETAADLLLDYFNRVYKTFTVDQLYPPK